MIFPGTEYVLAKHYINKRFQLKFKSMQSTGLLIPSKHGWDFKLMVIIAALMINISATAQQSIQHEPVPMPGSELRRFHSKIMDQDLLIYVQLPLDYI